MDMHVRICESSLPTAKTSTRTFGSRGTAGGDSVNYMDLMILDNRLVNELFQKPSDSGVSLNFESCVPRHQKSSVATHYFRRAVALSSNPTARQRSERKIEALVQQNGQVPSETIALAREKANKMPGLMRPTTVLTGYTLSKQPKRGIELEPGANPLSTGPSQRQPCIVWHEARDRRHILERARPHTRSRSWKRAYAVQGSPHNACIRLVQRARKKKEKVRFIIAV